MFKLEHPHNLISRLFMLEYMRELGAQKLYDKAKPEQRKNMFYKFEDTEGNVQVDLNWEACIFEMSITQLEFLLKNFMKEIEEIELARAKKYEQKKEQVINENISAPVDVNVMDLAKAAIKDSKDKLSGADGFSIN